MHAHYHNYTVFVCMHACTPLDLSIDTCIYYRDYYTCSLHDDNKLYGLPYSGYISRVYIFVDVPLERFSRI